MKKEIVQSVQTKVTEYQKNGQLHFPANYSPENAMKGAWLILQGTVDKNKQPVLHTCTKESIINSMLTMVVLGLNANKKQGYFIAYGKSLAFQPSYFGNVSILKRVTDCKDIAAEVIYEGDKIEYDIVGGNKRIKHEQKFENMNNKIVGAYATITTKEGKEISEVMTIQKIKKSWKMSRQNPILEDGSIKRGTVHDDFTEEMAKRTVLNRLAKLYINSSNDSSLVLDTKLINDEKTKQLEIEEESDNEENIAEENLEDKKEPQPEPRIYAKPPKTQNPDYLYSPTEEESETTEDKEQELNWNTDSSVE